MSFPAADPRKAGREAAERRDWVDAYEFLRTVDDPGPGDLELLADVALWSRHGQDRIDLLERAAAEYLRAEDPHGAARLSLKLCRDHWERGDAAVAGGFLHQARSLLADLPESPEHAYLMWILARGAMNQGDMDERRRPVEPRRREKKMVISGQRREAALSCRVHSLGEATEREPFAGEVDQW
jgi:hypothetical protein